MWPLMKNNITREDLDNLIAYLSQEEPRLTNGEQVKLFEDEWSQWIGTDYSVMVNSGASANQITMDIVKEIKGSGEVIVSPLNWVSDITSILRAGLRPRFVDIDLRTMGMDLERVMEAINPSTRAVLLTHIMGYNALEPWFLDQDRPMLINDVCESYGATLDGVQIGALGEISNSSFFYAHIGSTIEGGMISTSTAYLADFARIMRSHGMVRESTNERVKQIYAEEHPDIYPEFTFAIKGYNNRPTEINGVLGRSQLRRLDSNIALRNRNLKAFLETLDISKYYTDFKQEGCANYALTLMLREPDNDLMRRVIDLLTENDIEFRRGMSGGGNQIRQPYMRPYLRELGIEPEDFPNTEFVHKYSLYLGNYPELEVEPIQELATMLNKL